MCEQQYQAEVLDEEEMLDAEGQPIDLAEQVFQLGCYLNRVRLAEMQADLPPHKRTGYAEQMAEQADIRRKEIKEDDYTDWSMRQGEMGNYSRGKW